MEEATTKGIYDFHSFFYDATFGRLVQRRIARAISHMNIRDDHWVLDLGIGTGVQVDYRYKLENIDLWETVVITNNKSAVRGVAA